MLRNKIRDNIKKVVALGTFGIITLTSTISVSALSRRVCVIDGENITSFYSISPDTQRMLKKADITVYPDDTVKRKDEEKDVSIEVFRAYPVPINEENKSPTTVNISCGTVSDAIEKSGIEVGDEDIVTPEPSMSLKKGMEISISRRYRVKLKIGNDVKEVVVPSGSVRKALEFLDLPLGEEDSVNVDPESNVFEGMEIDLVRVSYSERKENEDIPFSTITRVSENMYEGEKKVEEGENGLKEVTFQDRMVNGEVVETKRLSENVITPAKDKIVYIGIKRKSQTVQSFASSKSYKDNKNGTLTDDKGNVVPYKSKINGTASAYTAPAGKCTSTGRRAEVGVVAVDPKVIPYGTKLYIPGYGYAIAGDTGPYMLNGSRLVDLFFGTESECFNYGVRNVNVYIL